MSYQHSYAHSISDPAAFWAEQAADLAWHRKPALTLQDNADFVIDVKDDAIVSGGVINLMGAGSDLSIASDRSVFWQGEASIKIVLREAAAAKGDEQDVAGFPEPQRRCAELAWRGDDVGVHLVRDGGSLFRNEPGRGRRCVDHGGSHQRRPSSR